MSREVTANKNEVRPPQKNKTEQEKKLPGRVEKEGGKRVKKKPGQPGEPGVRRRTQDAGGCRKGERERS